MEKLGEMLTRRQLMLVMKQLAGKAPVREDATLELINQIGNSKFFHEKGTATRWRIDYENGSVIGVHRELNYFV